MIKLNLLTCLVLIGCGSTKHHSDTLNLTILGNVSAIQGGSVDLNGARVVDSSLVDGTLFYDFDDGRKFSSKLPNGAFVDQGGGLNFTYVMKHDGVFYRFGQSNWDIYLDSSANGITWTKLNGGLPVLRHSADPSSAWHFLWNVGVDVDANGLWHILIECSDNVPDQLNVGLCYATGDLSGFTHISENYVISHGGNPYVKALPEGLLVVHGQINDAYGPFDARHWYITASTLAAGDSVFFTHKDKFVLGTPGIHDCDPHMELNGPSLTLVLSVDQSHLQTAQIGLTYEQFFERLTQ